VDKERADTHTVASGKIDIQKVVQGRGKDKEAERKTDM
jgi:hypothetical protein